MREDTQGPPLVNPFHNVFFLIYDDNYLINFFKKKLLRNWVKDRSICGMSVDLPDAASQDAVPLQQPGDIGCGRHFSVFVSVSFPLTHPTDTLCPLAQILLQNSSPETLNPNPFTPEPVLV
jgi:hypothetical protein